jgi:hypothetical protein
MPTSRQRFAAFSSKFCCNFQTCFYFILFVSALHQPGVTALMAAAAHNHISCMEYLLGVKASIGEESKVYF